MPLPKAIAFDIDETLTESKQPLTPHMAGLLARLLERTSVAAVSGGKFEVFEQQLYAHLPKDAHVENLYSLPNAGAAMFAFRNGGWATVYEVRIEPSEAEHIKSVMDRVARESGTIDFSKEPWGERIEYRTSSVTLSALGQAAPIDAKKAWDPNHEKRIKLRDMMAVALPEYDVKRGGTTSIDVTKPGVHKGYGVQKLSEYLGISIADMLYVGDALFPGGNDAIVKETGIPTRATSGPIETARIIEEVLMNA